ncbi:MAG: SRPBCC family protein [Longimicrobiales bacterium]
MEIRTEVQIDASAPDVWRVLTDFDEYPAWNPFIRTIRGSLVKGAKLEVEIQPPGRRPIRFNPTVLNVTPERELRWIGHLKLPGLLDGEHVFEIEPTGPRSVRFVQRERFIGIAVLAMRWLLQKSTIAGFEDMNEALKARAEALSA